MSIYEKNISGGIDLSTRSLYYYRRELYDNNKIKEAIEYFNLFLNKDDGWVEDKICACNLISKCYDKLNEAYNCLKSLLRSFEFDLPRAENCCETGNYYFNLK